MFKMNPKDEDFTPSSLPGAGLVSGGFSLLGDNWTTIVSHLPPVLSVEVQTLD